MKQLQTSFQRIETKYILPKEVAEALQVDMLTYMKADDYAHSTITNVYFDSPDFQMIQDAMAKKNGREKMRMRTYDATPTADSRFFLEIKKKDGEIGHKYRLVASAQAIVDFVEKNEDNEQIDDQRVEGEVHQLQERYGLVQPMMYIAYRRTSFKGIADKDVRITFDSDLIYRNQQVTALDQRYGHPLLDPNFVIMEVKLPGLAPAWLTELFDQYELVEQSFSKYGVAYRKSIGQSAI